MRRRTPQSNRRTLFALNARTHCFGISNRKIKGTWLAVDTSYSDSAARRSVTPRLQSARTSCVVVPLAQTPRTTSTSKERTYMCNGMQLKLQTAAPTQAVSSRPTLLVRAASVPAVPKIIRQGTLPPLVCIEPLLYICVSLSITGSDLQSEC